MISSSKPGLFILGSVFIPLVMTFRCACGIAFSEEDLRRPCYKYGLATTSTAGANQRDAARASGYWQRLGVELNSKKGKGLCTIGERRVGKPGREKGDIKEKQERKDTENNRAIFFF